MKPSSGGDLIRPLDYKFIWNLFARIFVVFNCINCNSSIKKIHFKIEFMYIIVVYNLPVSFYKKKKLFLQIARHYVTFKALLCASNNLEQFLFVCLVSFQN